MSEEFFQFIESPETATIRLNTDAMSHLGTLFNSVNDTVMKQAVFDMLYEGADLTNVKCKR